MKFYPNEKTHKAGRKMFAIHRRVGLSSYVYMKKKVEGCVGRLRLRAFGCGEDVMNFAGYFGNKSRFN